MSQRIKEKTLFGWLRNIFKKGDGGVHNDHHESLSDEDKIVEDFIEVGKFIVKRLKLVDVIGFDCDLVNENDCPLRAILSDKSIVKLDFDKYVSHNDGDMTERLMESEAIIDYCDRQYIQDKIIEESAKFYSDK